LSIPRNQKNNLDATRKIGFILGMILSRLEGKHASCRFSTAGAESHATDAVAFVAALLASQFMLLVTCRKKVAQQG